MKFNEIAPRTLVSEAQEDKDRRIATLTNQRATLKQKLKAACESDNGPEMATLAEKLTRLDELLESMTGTRSPRAELEAKLKQLKSDYDELPKNPQTQRGYDALDDLRDEIADVEKKLSLLKEGMNTPDEAFEDAKMRATIAISALTDAISEFARHQKRNSRDWGYAGTMASVASRLEELVVHFGAE